jgi:uncharacterized phage protein (TIGR02218 family)
MKPIPAALLTLLTSQKQLPYAELFTFTFRDGTHDYFTDLDVPIAFGGNTFKANSLRIEGLKFKIGVGWQVDEQEIKISAFPGETLGGSSFFGAVESGLLDGATIQRQRAFFTPLGGPAYLDYAAAPAGVVTLFTGLVSTISKIGRTQVEMKLKSPLKLLDIDMPRNTYQPGCQWDLYSSFGANDGCRVNRAAFTQTFTVSTANATRINPVGGIAPQFGADGLAYFAQGRLLFTSGVNNNLETTIADNDSVTFVLRFPLNNIPAPGDTFTASAGCSKLGRGGACELKFNNLPNFRGFPRVPPIVISV